MSSLPRRFPRASGYNPAWVKAGLFWDGYFDFTREPASRYAELAAGFAIVGSRRVGAHTLEPVMSIPPHYTKKPMHRGRNR